MTSRTKMNLTIDQRNAWAENGYLLLKNFHSEQKINQLNSLIDDLWLNRKSLDEKYVIDIFVETEQEKRVYFCDAPKEARNKPYKLNDLFLSSAFVREMVAGENLSPILNDLLQGQSMICNSLNFEFGSQQDYHFDTFYMPSPTPNKMVATWIALEDTNDQNGPLSYYPGSHKIPPFHFSNGSTIIVPEEMAEFDAYMNKEIAERELKPETLIAEKGDLLIWHSQLFHGGSPIKDKSLTRKSLVTHYFTKEDFPDLEPAVVSTDSYYMNRAAQAVPYPFAPPKNWFQRIFNR